MENAFFSWKLQERGNQVRSGRHTNWLHDGRALMDPSMYKKYIYIQRKTANSGHIVINGLIILILQGHFSITL